MKQVFGANLKQNPVDGTATTIWEAGSGAAFLKLLQGYQKIGLTDSVEIIVFTPGTHLCYAYERFPGLFNSRSVRLGVQDISEFLSGAHTGEITPIWARQLGATDVLIGHSEIRETYEKIIMDAVMKGLEQRELDDSHNLSYLNLIRESGALTIDSMFNRKMKTALNHGLRPTYCVGETEYERNNNMTERVIARQIKTGLDGLESSDLIHIIIAYEPRWAIGGNKPTPTMQEIEAAHEAIRSALKGAGHPDSDSATIIYGGSMKPENAREIMAVPGVNGGLIGTACLDPEKFQRIVDYDRQ